jgi:membrane protein implicated in regulation of membrane protease activity
MDFIFEPWHWFVLGILLILSELILPAFAALWFGIAAVVVSILFWLFPSMSFALQVVCWIILSIICTVAWF